MRKLRREFLPRQLGGGTAEPGGPGAAGTKFAFLSMLEDDDANFDACQLMNNLYVSVYLNICSYLCICICVCIN